MSEPAQCQCCGETFYPDQHWKRLCLPCWKKTKRAENPELDELRLENSRLRFELALVQVRGSQAIPRDLLKTLIRLTHPDKHGNSQAANDATAWLLAQRSADVTAGQG